MRRRFLAHGLVVALAAGVATLSGQAAPALVVDRPAPGAWVIDPARSTVEFNVTKLGFSDVTGTFRESAGDVRYDPSNIAASSIRWRVRVASVATDDSRRDQSLQASEYFDAAHHPELTFESRGARPAPDGAFIVTGDLTMRGVTRRLTTTVRVRPQAPGPSFETSFEVNRYDYGIAGGTVMGRLIGSAVRVRIVAATQPAPAGIR